MEFSLRKDLHTAQGPITLEAELRVAPGELLIITGPSGGGKTTLLRILAGLLRPERGRIEVDGEVWLDTETKRFVPSQARRVGMVFQEYALFPNMTVRENLHYALPDTRDRALVEELVAIMEIDELIGRYPATLSGGQQQRVAVARALVRRPRLLLLDEPLSALDIDLRLKLQDYILRAHRRYGLTTLMVSHDQDEIRKMAQRVVRLEAGRLIELPPPSGTRSDASVLVAEILRVAYRDGETHLHLRAGEATLVLPLAGGAPPGLRTGACVRLALDEGELRLLGRHEDGET